jgi:signal transduction histidine kinase
MSISHRSIRSRLTRRLIVGVSLMILLAEVILFFTVRATLHRHFDEALTTRAFALVSLVEYEDYELIFEFSSADAIELPYGSMPKYVSIWDESGKQFWFYPESRKNVLPHLEPGTLRQPRYYDIEAGGHGHIRAAAMSFKPVRVEFEDPSAVVDAAAVLKDAPLLDMVIADDRRYLDVMLRELLFFLILGNALATGAIALFIGRAIGKELHPLGNISQQVARLDIDNLGSRFQADNLPNELVPIAQRLNDFLIRLEKAVERERRFTSFAAHELRTPLSELRSVLEIADRWPEDADPAETRTECLQIGARMEKLVQTLLELTRCQAGTRMVEEHSCHIEDVVLGSMEPFRNTAAERDVRLITSFAGNPELRTDGDLLSAILTNLLSNAVNQASPGSNVRIDTRCNRESFAIRISNHQDSLKTDDLKRLFEPFWQKDPARTQQGNIGMGLTLSSAYAELLNGRISADLEKDGRITFTITVPLTPP